MDKEALLAKNRKQGPDEREKQIYLDAYSFSGSVSIVLCLLLMGYSWYHGETFYQYSMIVFANMTATNLYRFAKLKTRKFLVPGLLELAATLAVAVAFLLGWT